MTRQAGFTLVEVLVALALLTVGIMVMMETMGSTANHARMLEDHTEAYLVASNKLVEYQVFNQYLNVGTNDEVLKPDEDNPYGRTWHIRTKVTAGPYPDTRRVDIEVGPEPASGSQRQVTFVLTSVLGKPAPRFTPAANNDQDPQS